MVLLFLFTVSDYSWITKLHMGTWVLYFQNLMSDLSKTKTKDLKPSDTTLVHPLHPLTLDYFPLNLILFLAKVSDFSV